LLARVFGNVMVVSLSSIDERIDKWRAK